MYGPEPHGGPGNPHPPMNGPVPPQRGAHPPNVDPAAEAFSPPMPPPVVHEGPSGGPMDADVPPGDVFPVDVAPPMATPRGPGLPGALLAAQVLLVLMSFGAFGSAVLEIVDSGARTPPVVTVLKDAVLWVVFLFSVLLIGLGRDGGRVLASAAAGVVVVACSVELIELFAMSSLDDSGTVGTTTATTGAGAITTVVIVPALAVLLLLSTERSTDWFRGHAERRRSLTAH